MTEMERISREKSDKRASETRIQARIVAEEIIRRRKRFFQEAVNDKMLMEMAVIWRDHENR